MENCVYDYLPSRMHQLIEGLRPDTILSREEVAIILGVKPFVIDQWSKYGGMRISKIGPPGASYRWRDVVAWLSQRM